MRRPRLVLMGRAGGAFGLKGELRVFSYARDPQIFLRAGVIYAGPSPEQAKPYTVLSLRPHAGRVLLRLREFSTREEAQTLKGTWVWIRREALPPLAEDEYYWDDLRGARVFTTTGRELGRVFQVTDYGAHEIWIVRDETGREALIPIIPGVVQEMDVEGGRLVVEPPPGLLEAQGWEEFSEPEEGGGRGGTP